MSTVEESIIEVQRKIISIQDELNVTNDSIIELLRLDNARLTKELDTLTRKTNDLVYVPYTNEQTSSMVEDIEDTNEYLREQD